MSPRGQSSGGSAPVSVVVRASDPMNELGAASILSADGRLRLLAPADGALAEVIVVVEESIDHGVFEYLREVRTLSPFESPPRCVLVTDHLQPDVLMTAIEQGMAAVLWRGSTDGDELVQTVFAVSQGSASLPPQVLGGLLTQLQRLRRDVLAPSGFTLSGLSPRERDVLRLLAEGHDTEEIAAELVFSTSTVKNVLRGVMTRCGLNSRSHAVAFALRTGAI